MDLQQLKNDRDAVEILIRTQLKSFIEKHYYVQDIEVSVIPVFMAIDSDCEILRGVDVKIKIKI